MINFRKLLQAAGCTATIFGTAIVFLILLEWISEKYSIVAAGLVMSAIVFIALTIGIYYSMLKEREEE